MPTLELSAEQFALLYDSLPDPVWILQNEKVVYANPAAVSALGYPDTKSLLAAHPREFSPLFQPDGEKSSVKARRMFARVKECGNTRFHWEHRRADGELFITEVTLAVTQLAEGSFVVSLWRDISEPLRVEQKLLAARDRFYSIFEKSPDPVWLICDQKFVDCNDAAVKLLGYPDKTSLFNMHPSELSPMYQPDGRDSFSKAHEMMQIAEELGIHRFEWMHKKCDNSEFMAEVTLTSLSLAGEKVIYCAWRDITDRKQAEQELQLSYQRFSRLFELSADPAMLIRGVRLIDCNDAAAQALGYTHKVDLIGLHPAEISPPVQSSGEDSADLVKRMGQIAMEQGVHRFEWVFLRRDGSLYYADLALMRMELSDGPAMYCTLRDITQRKMDEARIQAMAVDLQFALQAAQGASDAKTRFLATVSHEIRTPLNGVLGMAQLLADSSLEPEQVQSYAHTILNSGHVLMSLLNDILDYSKLEAGQIQLEQREFRPHNLVRDVCQLFAHGAQAKGLALHHETTLGRSIYRGDEYRVHQMVSNLVNNAIKFTSQGEVQVLVSELSRDLNKAVLEFEVVDTGIGISPAQQRMLFQPFSQADSSTTRKFRGTGLGLSIVAKLAEQMSGHASVESSPGRGSRFKFQIEVEPVGESLDMIQTDWASLPLFDDDAADMPCVVVVDSQASSRMMHVLLLEKMGLQVYEVSSGGNLLALLQRGVKVRAMLIDMGQAMEASLEFARVARSWEKHAGAEPISIIALTGEADDHLLKHCRMAGMNLHIQKPLSLSSLRKALAMEETEKS